MGGCAQHRLLYSAPDVMVWICSATSSLWTDPPIARSFRISYGFDSPTATFEWTDPAEPQPQHFACRNCGVVLSDELPDVGGSGRVVLHPGQMQACYGEPDGRLLCNDCRRAARRAAARATLIDRPKPKRY